MRIQKSTFLNWEQRTPYLIARRDHRKIIKAIKELLGEYAPVTV